MSVTALTARYSARLKTATGLSPAILGFWLLLAVMPLFIRNQYILRLALVSLYFGIQAATYDFTNGFIGISNFGFAGFLGLGGYTSALMMIHLGVNPVVGALGAALAAGILGLLTGLLTLRLKGIYAACMAWFVQMALMGLAIVQVDWTRGTLGLTVPYAFDTPATVPYYYELLGLGIGIYVVLTLIVSSRTGLAFRAIGQNLTAARVSGVNATKYKVLNWTVACTCAGLLGSFYAHYIGILTPDIMHFKHTVEVIALSYIGGRGTLWGGLVASFLVIPLFESLKPLMEIRLIAYGLLLVLTMILYPAGLAGLVRAARQAIEKSRQRGK